MKEPVRKKLTNVICFIHRKKYAEVPVEAKPYFEEGYDFCDDCQKHMLRNFERDMLGMTLRTRERKS